MRLVGIMEMFVGLGILSPGAGLASYAASSWLVAIAANLWLNGDYDVAVRDLNMAVAAFALAQLSRAREEDRQEAELVGRHLRAA